MRISRQRPICASRCLSVTPCGPTPDATCRRSRARQKVYDFTAHARRQPTAPPPGDRIDAQLANHADAITAVQLAVEISKRSRPKPVDVEGPARAILAQAERAAAGDPPHVRRCGRRSSTKPSLSSSACGLRPTALGTPPTERKRAWRRRCSTPRRAPRPSSAMRPPARRCRASVMAQAVFTPATTPARLRSAPTTRKWRSNGPSTCPTPSRPTSWRSTRSPASIGRPLVGQSRRQRVRHARLVVHGRVARPAADHPLDPDRGPHPARRDVFRHRPRHDAGVEWLELGSPGARPGQGDDGEPVLSRRRRPDRLPAQRRRSFRACFRLQPDGPEGLLAHVNGVRLEPTYDFTVDTVASASPSCAALRVNSIVTFDLLTPAAQLTPSGSVNTVLLSPDRAGRRQDAFRRLDRRHQRKAAQRRQERGASGRRQRRAAEPRRGLQRAAPTRSPS